MSPTESIQMTTVTVRHQVNAEPQSSASIESLSPIATVNQLYGEDNPDDYPDGGLKAYSVILGSFLGLIVNLGLINSIGAIQAYVSTHQLQDLPETSISWISPSTCPWHTPVVCIWQFILSFISLGIGNGLGMTPLIGVISHWFLKKRGNCTGLATSGGSVGGLIFPLMLRHSYTAYGLHGY
ncbi:putative transporter MCH4 [Candida viswanathii]|uniref:Putative transporter MCH4 n=1 Tax=Candida viswanathii TaxID=5486 RepID=A0A367XUY3_9ASCO|nr:putative transporter MCH4 [Candida viswanathii]